MDAVKTTCWLQIVPMFKRGKIAGARVERVTQTRPDHPLPAAVMLQLTLDIPPSVWGPLRAEGTLPEGAKIVPFAIEVPDEEGA